MKISTKGRYGLRAMVDLAVYGIGEHVSLNSIAERQGVSVSYLEQVFSVLRKAGLVNSIKGAQGGYVLAEPSARIKVGTILRALEGDLNIINESSESPDSLIQHCIKTSVWDKINESINKVVDDVTLADLVEAYYKRNTNGADMYYI